MEVSNRLLATDGLYRPSLCLRWHAFLYLRWLTLLSFSFLFICLSQLCDLLATPWLFPTESFKACRHNMDKELLLSDVSSSVIVIFHFAFRDGNSKICPWLWGYFSLSQLFILFPCIQLSLECCQKLSLSHHPPAVAKTLTHMPIAIQSFIISLNFSYMHFTGWCQATVKEHPFPIHKHHQCYPHDPIATLLLSYNNQSVHWLECRNQTQVLTEEMKGTF